MAHLILRLFLGILIMGFFSCQKSNQKLIWKVTNLWSSCSVSCDIGIRYKLVICVKKTLYGTEEQLKDEKCLTVKKPDTRIVEACFYGNCPDMKNNEYVWKVTEWNACSKSCGGSGIRTREVICILILKSGNRLEVPYSNCNSLLEPKKSERCAITDCPPEFVTTPWNKCTKNKKCSPGIRRRKIKCIVTLSNGKFIRVPSGHCYRIYRPPVSWEHCVNDPAYQETCKYRQKIEKMKTPIISVSHSKMHQMRKIDKLRLVIGQKAFILPYTSLVIKCQVKNYPASNIEWIRNNKTIKYIGKIDSRVFITRRGSLVIKKFYLDDVGLWYCVAKNVSESIQLFLKSPSKGFEEWIYRNIYRKEMIVQIKFDVNYLKAVSYQWVVGSWSTCSETCGEKGFQIRKVDCEELTSQYFLEVEERLCTNSSQYKPINTRTCNGLTYCPQWSIINTTFSNCSNSCVDFNSALLDIPILCTFKDKVLPDTSCDSLKKPLLKCFNQNCDVHWEIGIWSQCSRSCGSSGMRSRTINCLWKSNNESAGSLCYKKSLNIPLVIEACYPPPCKLDCLDLSKYCGIPKLCWNNRYRFLCCRTCFSE